MMLKKTIMKNADIDFLLSEQKLLKLTTPDIMYKRLHEKNKMIFIKGKSKNEHRPSIMVTQLRYPNIQKS